MKYYLTKNETKIEAKPEKWAWGVIYNDGTELKQFCEDGTFHQFVEIEQSKVQMFIMYQLENHNKRIDLVTEGKNIFHFYRHTTFSMLTPEQRKVQVYCFGYKDKDKTAYHYILPDDRVVIADKDIDITKFNI